MNIEYDYIPIRIGNDGCRSDVLCKKNSKKTHFLDKLKTKNPKFLQEFEIIGEYVNTNTRILVSNKYGQYLTLPSSLLAGDVPSIQTAVNKTKIFTNMLKYSNPSFLKRFEILTNYIDNKTKILTSNEYGNYLISPIVLMKGCLPNIQSAVNKNKVFKNMAKEIHHEFYDYSKIEYINNITKICIVCPVHGEFWQTPSAHMLGNGCKKCSNAILSSKRRFSLADFMEATVKAHGNFYDYSKVNYINMKTKVCIICPTHGEFWQTPDTHLSGKRCRKCSDDEAKGFYTIKNAEKNKEEWITIDAKVYLCKLFDNSTNECFYKIGITKKSILSRISKIPYTCKILNYIETNIYEACFIEHMLHEYNKPNKYITNKLFNGKTECFHKVDIENFKEVKDNHYEYFKCEKNKWCANNY